jgi:hypothetical protein
LIVVEFPDEASLRAATEAISAVVSAEGGTNEQTPAYRAERALDSKLLDYEESKPPTKVWTMSALLHVVADNAEDAVEMVDAALGSDAPVTVTTPDGHSMQFVWMNLPEAAEYAYDLRETQ